MNLSKLIIADAENNIETCFAISRYKHGVFVPRNMRSKKIVCTMVFDDNTTTRNEFNSVDELNEYLSNEPNGKKMYVYQGLSDTLPQLSYCDITEKLLISSNEMSNGILSSDTHGMLAWFGIRKLSVSFDKKFDKVTVVSAELRVKTANGESVDDRIFIENSGVSVNENSVTFLFDVDTDKLGRLFDNPKFVTFENLRLVCSVRVLALTESDNNEVEFFYPMDISLINTKPSVFRSISQYPASIDFGTTSTCVAVKKREGNELLTISPLDSNVSTYENPTNLMVFDWDTIYKEWIEKCDTVIPSFYKGGKQENTEWLNKQSENPVHFDFGYKVKDELGAELTNRRTINSIMTLLKMIPYRIIHDNRRIQFNPYNDSEKYVYIVTSPDEQDEEHFDPIAFYGYLIGRMINDRSKQKKIHTRFQVTSPVKFNDEVRESIKNSLLYGLKRTVPKPLQELVKVEMVNCEPVAFIGAICGTDYLTVSDNEPVRFAVYDFGGGTLDFSFGEVFCNDEGETIIDVRMTGGDETIGGESIIERLTFMIYKHNIDQMKSKQIPIEKPVNEQRPDNFDERLLISTPYSIANANIINYRISRKIFEGGSVEQKYSIELYDLSGEPVMVEINCPKDELDSYVKKVVRESVKLFSGELKSAFADFSSNDIDKIRIFLAGNSSRNKHVVPAMEEAFPKNKIERPDETVIVEEEKKTTEGNAAARGGRRRTKSSGATSESTVDVSASVETTLDSEDTIAERAAETSVRYVEASNVNRRYALTPKTAVALGQLQLHDILVKDRTKSSFMMNVGYAISVKREFKTVLKKGTVTNEWVKFKNVPTGGTVSVYYSESGLDFSKHTTTPYPYYEIEGEAGKVLFVRIKDKYIIDYCFVEAEETPTDNVEIHALDFSRFLSKED